MNCSVTTAIGYLPNYDPCRELRSSFNRSATQA